ncbi:hypothetical protein SMAC4_13992 [Sordaria macrospora]|uniref:uncharacterized protein n=1 Tax=Sordaria macrospora TaxID=5147 RepID=UPI002B2D99DD|nr:hypothetical protein SMAC4_13992 [Sordaria macrospora]
MELFVYTTGVGCLLFVILFSCFLQVCWLVHQRGRFGVFELKTMVGRGDDIYEVRKAGRSEVKNILSPSSGTCCVGIIIQGTLFHRGVIGYMMNISGEHETNWECGVV